MNLVYFAGWFFFRTVYKFYFGWRVYNAERGPHSRTGDTGLQPRQLCGSAFGRSRVNTRNQLSGSRKPFQISRSGLDFARWQAVPVDREGGGAKGLKAILDRLLAGGAIILFPEGTRTRDGRLQPARSGIGLTVIKSAAPVVPVRVFGTFEAYNRHMSFPRPFHRVSVKYGRPMHFEQLRAEAKTCTKPRLKEIYQEIAVEVMQAIAKLEPCEDKDEFP
jgi:1-acyl-sn-glycerol-3-phosphate acyltransferase